MDSPRMLLIGSCGMLARAWKAVLDQQKIPHVDVDYPQFDLTDAASIACHLTGDFSGGLVINCAAWTDVDGAEAQEAKATLVNGTGVGLLADRCREIGATLVHYSTDYVFSGQGNVPWPVHGIRQPVNAYGRSKAAGEVAIEQSGVDHLLIRTSWLYAPWGNNFVRTIARLAKTRSSLKVVDDQHGRPTSAEHLAMSSWRLLQAKARRTFHVTDGGQDGRQQGRQQGGQQGGQEGGQGGQGGGCSWYEFAKRIAAWSNPACTVEPCTSAEFSRPAKRPAYSVLEIAATEAILGPMPGWQANLESVLSRLEPL